MRERKMQSGDTERRLYSNRDLRQLRHLGSTGSADKQSSNDEQFQADVFRINAGQKYKRVDASLGWYIFLSLCLASIPIFNLYLIISNNYQANKLSKIGQKYTISVYADSTLNAAGQSFTNYYVLIAVYFLISSALLFNVFSVGSVRERLKIFFAVDTLLLCSLASALSHVALHLQFFCGNFFGNTFIVVWQDYMVMVLYIVTNFIMLGKFRISMLYVRWQVWQVVFLKVLLVFASLVYFAIELQFLFGLDSATSAYNKFNQLVFYIINHYDPVMGYYDVYRDYYEFVIPLAMFENKVQNCVIMYASTNFAFFFEIIQKLSDFDGTSDLKTSYVIGNDDEQQRRETY